MKMNQVVYNVRGNIRGVWVDMVVVVVLLLMTPSTFNTDSLGWWWS